MVTKSRSPWRTTGLASTRRSGPTCASHSNHLATRPRASGCRSARRSCKRTAVRCGSVTQPVAEPASSSPSQSTADFDILVVDDEPALCDAVSAALEARGYRTRTARSGREALAATSLHEPDIVLLDLGLP